MQSNLHEIKSEIAEFTDLAWIKSSHNCQFAVLWQAMVVPGELEFYKGDSSILNADKGSFLVEDVQKQDVIVTNPEIIFAMFKVCLAWHCCLLIPGQVHHLGLRLKCHTLRNTMHMSGLDFRFAEYYDYAVFTFVQILFAFRIYTDNCNHMIVSRNSSHMPYATSFTEQHIYMWIHRSECQTS